MKVSRVGQIVEIKMVPSEFSNSSGIGQDVAPALTLENDAEACLNRIHPVNQGRVHPGFSEELQRHAAEMVVADTRLKTYSAAECGQIVGDNRRRASQSEHHVIGQELTFRGKLIGEAVENEVRSEER